MSKLPASGDSKCTKCEFFMIGQGWLKCPRCGERTILSRLPALSEDGIGSEHVHTLCTCVVPAHPHCRHCRQPMGSGVAE
jgi:hypothetical protein